MDILIIEDEPGICEFLREGLAEEGYRVTVAGDGEQGLSEFRRLKPALVLLDWMMPGMSGIEVCRGIRNSDATTPIIFLTAKDTVAETVEGLRAGANDYVRKPFSFAELLERIRVHFRNQSDTATLSLDGILLDTASRRVFSDGAEVALTQREFNLLELLVRNKGRVCTRDEIIGKVWNINFEYDTGVIDVFINSLRKKLGIDKERGPIKTVRGAGYIANDR